MKCNAKSCLKPYIDINIHLRKAAKNDFKKDFSKSMNNVAFGKTKKNVQKTCNHRKKKKLFGITTKLSYYKVFYRKCVGYRNEKTKIPMNKPVYLGLSVQKLSKTEMHEF